MNQQERNARFKKVTIADIAESVGVSKNSVSLALRGLDGVGPDLRRRIIEKSIEMGYLNDQSMPSALQDACVAVVVPEYVHGDAFFYSEILWAIDNELTAHGACSVHIVVTKEMEEAGELPTLPKGLDVIGLLLVGIFDAAYMEKLKTVELPQITVDMMHNGFPYIGSSNLMGGLTATKKLIELGHKEIGFIGPIYAAPSIYERWNGFNLAMGEAGLPVKNAYNILGDGNFLPFNTEEALEPYVSKMEKLPTAWFCAGDRIAIAMIHLLTRMGKRIPEDISIMGFDDILAAQMVLPCLTTIRTDRQLMGKLAVSHFFETRRNKDLAQVSKIVPFELIERDSVTHPKER